MIAPRALKTILAEKWAADVIDFRNAAPSRYTDDSGAERIGGIAMKKSITLIGLALLLASCNPASPPETAKDRALRAGASGRELTLADMSPKNIEGTLGKPFGTAIVLEGEIVDSPRKGMRDPVFRIGRVDGEPYGNDWHIHIESYDLEFGESSDDRSLPELIVNHRYELEGYETGRFQGVPREVYRREGLGGFATMTDLVWVSDFVVFAGREVRTPQSAPTTSQPWFAVPSTSAPAMAQPEFGICDMWAESITGELGRPLGVAVKIAGEIVESPTKFGMDYPNLRVTRIADQAVAQPRVVLLTPYPRMDFGRDRFGREQGLPQLIKGHRYELEVYETGGFKGVPWDVYQREGMGGFATSDLGWVSEIVVFAGREIDPPQSAPAATQSR